MLDAELTSNGDGELTSPDVQVPLRKLLRDRMDALGWSQAQVARELDVSPSQVSRWLDGHGLSIDRIPAVAKFLDIDEGALAVAAYRGQGQRRRAIDNAESDDDVSSLVAELVAESTALQARLARLEELFAERVRSSDQHYAEMLEGLRSLRAEMQQRRSTS